MTPDYVGPILFNAPWYSSPAASIQERFFPVQCGPMLFFQTFKRMLAFGPGGELLWSYGLTDVSPDPRFRVNPSPYRNKRADAAAGRQCNLGETTTRHSGAAVC